MAVLTRQRSYEHQDLWDKFWKDKHGDVVIWQRPNLLLIAWVVLTLLSLFVPRGAPEAAFWWAAEIALAGWAILELVKGVNYFRRALGAVVLLLTIMSIFKMI